LVCVNRPNKPAAVVRVADVGGGGARLTSAGGSFAIGEQVQITPLAAGSVLRGRVVWSRGGEIAVEFARADLATRLAATKMVDAAISRWSEAREIGHPFVCRCDLGGPVLEPLLPRSALRRAEGI
jgi:hypothetical protein